uniref:Uncharacterized protein n=1 Tax=Amphiprion ocellaris TaxID=80972 RepID=A0AAQ5X8H3_AMPOC
MMGRWNLLILVLFLSSVIVPSESDCPAGFITSDEGCIDENDCAVDEDYPEDVGKCGENTLCFNTNGSFYCQCAKGFRSSTLTVNFTGGSSATCRDINECSDMKDICGPNAICFNTIGNYSCICDDGFVSTTGVESFRYGDNVKCIDILLPNVTDVHLTQCYSAIIIIGFTTVSLLSYSNLENSANGFSGGMKPEKNQSFKINSKVVTVAVSNRNTSHLKEEVKLTLYHLKKSNQTSHTCVFWDSSEKGGSWSARGCEVVESNMEYTVCSCNHLSSFAVLMSLCEMKLQLITWVGLSLSLICLFICILTFSMIRSIQSPRTTIHLHLCISLFTANLIFLAGISRTENRVGCAVVAGMLHFFYMAAFCWMCLEGIQLFRMVVLVFNTSFKTLYMMAGGYGVPAVIVAVSALANAEGYGTDKYCWLKLEFIWSFFGPVCVIISVNIFFFLITVWKLAQKFSSLNPDLDKLQKIKAFTVTAVAQLCVLGTMWIFGCFQFEEGTVVMSYLFTIFGSLQGLMIFVMHCLFSKQVREEYGNILSRCCAPQKKRYSEFSSSHSSKAHVSSYLYFTAVGLG